MPRTQDKESTQRSCRADRAFTLIEVLVVVGIIAVLVAILTPSLALARQQSRAAVCANNIRQIGMGWQMYAQQWQDAAVAAGSRRVCRGR